jgi:hypothetical protein
MDRGADDPGSTAQYRLLGHDVRVVAGVSRPRRGRDQRVQVGRASYPAKLAGAVSSAETVTTPAGSPRA